MIGAFLITTNQDGEFDPIILHKIQNKTIFEYSLDNLLKSEQLQKIITLIPNKERSKIRGGGIKFPEVKGDQSFLGRQSGFHFFKESDLLGACYQAAMQNQLDHILIAYANSPVIPPWLINNITYYYFKNKIDNLLINSEYDLGFQVAIVPYWELVNFYLYESDRTLSSLFKKNHSIFPNKDDSFLKQYNLDLRFTSYDQENMFDFILSEMSNGLDLEFILEDLSESEKV